MAERQVSQIYKVMVNGSLVMSVHGSTEDEARTEAEQQLDRPGRRTILNKWKAEGRPLFRDKKFENHIRRNILESNLQTEAKVFDDYVGSTVAGLRRMADEIERRAKFKDDGLESIAREASHTVAWGVANLSLDRLHRSAAIYDQSKAMLRMMEELEVE